MKRIKLLLCLSLFIMLFDSGAQAQKSNILSIPDIQVRAGANMQMPVNVNNTDEFTALQFDITLPVGCVINSTAAEITARCTDHEVEFRKVDNQKWRCLLYSPSNAPVKGQSGTVLYLPFQTSESLKENTDYVMSINECTISAINGDDILTQVTVGLIHTLKLPDLEIDDVMTSATTVTPGDKLSVSWTVRNIGDIATEDGWYETISLVSADGLTNKQISSIWYDVTLSSAAIVSRNVELEIPAVLGFDGSCYIQVKLVPGKNAGEPTSAQANNTAQTINTLELEKKLTLTLDKISTVENYHTSVNCKLVRSGNWSSDQTFNVYITDDERVNGPSSVTITAGQSASTFDISITDDDNLQDDLVDIVVTVDGNAYEVVSQTFSLENDDLPKLEFYVPDFRMTEGQTMEMTLTAERNVKEDTKVTIICDFPSLFTFPAEVTIPVGNNQVKFNITAMDDNLPSIDEDVTFKAVAQHHVDAEQHLLLEDDDMPILELLLIPNIVDEGGGANAVAAVVRRTTNTDSKITIKISDDSNGNLYFANKTLEMPKDVDEITFNFGPVDNSVVDGDRTYNITAAVYISSCACNASGQSAGVVSAQLRVLDNDGPTLYLTSSKSSVKEGEKVKLKITRNNSSVEQINVILTGDHDDAFENYNHSIIIPAGETSAEVELTVKSNSQIDDSFTASFVVSASGYSSGTCWMTVSDQSLPDAKLIALEFVSSEKIANSQIKLSVTLKNDGFANLPSQTVVKIYEQGMRNPILSLYSQSEILPGETVVLSDYLTLPANTGIYTIYAMVNGDKTVKEINYTNNTSTMASVNVLSPYQASVITDKSAYQMGDVVRFTGSVVGDAIENTPVEIYIISGGLRQTVYALLDESLNFSAEYQLLEKQMGHFIVGACYPKAGEKTEMTSFDVYGMKRTDDNTIKMDITQGETSTGKIGIINPGGLDLNGVQVKILSLPDNFSIDIDVPDVIQGGTTVYLNYSITGLTVSPEMKWYEIVACLTTSEGPTVNIPIYAYCRNQKACITTNIQEINATMNPGKTRTFPIEITNEGKGETGTIKLALPEWMACSNGNVISSLAQGETATILLELTPNENMQLNVPITGNIGINCQNGSGLALKYYVETVAEENGELILDVCDEFTYNTDEAPHVQNAEVIISHPYTEAVIAQGLTDEYGCFSAQLPEGYYKLNVTAPKHDTYSNFCYVNAGKTNKETVNIGYIATSFSWIVQETEVEDEYNVELDFTYETNVPVPVVKIDMPKKIDGDNMTTGDATLINMVLTNVGLVRADNVRVKLPENTSEWKFEALSFIEPFQLQAKQAVTVPVLITRVSDGTNASSRRRINSNSFNDCMAAFKAQYQAACGTDIKENESAENLALKACAYSVTAQAIGEVLSNVQIGGIGGGAGGQSNKPGAVNGDWDNNKSASQNNYDIKKTFDICDECDAKRIEQIIDKGLSYTWVGPINEAMNKALEDARSKYGKNVKITNVRKEIQDKVYDELKDKIIDTVDDAVEGGGKIATLAFDIAEVVNACADMQDSENPVKGRGNIQKAKPTHSWVMDFDEDAKAYINQLYLMDEILLDVFGNRIWYEEYDEEKMEFVNFVLSLPDGYDLTDDELMEHKPKSVSLEQLKDFVNYLNYDMSLTTEELYDKCDLFDTLEKDAIDEGYATSTAKFHAAYSEYKNHFENLKSESLCASISLNLSQSITMTRQAFRGTLTVFNGHETDAMENLKLMLDIRDDYGVVATSKEFQINLESLTKFNGTLNLDDGWSLDAGETGIATVLFIPSKYAAPETDKKYYFGGKITYLDPFNGYEVTRKLFPVKLTVKPSPDIDLYYFLQRDIIGDDPMTEDVVEHCEPAEFALVIDNKGFGDANNLRIITKQPEITLNDKGLLNRFFIESSQLNGIEKTMVLEEATNNFGTIPAHNQMYAQWWLHSDLLGHFTSYDFNMNHVTSYDNSNLSLIDNVSLHELIHGFTYPSVSEDNVIRGFLVNDVIDINDNPDAVYFSNATNESVGIANAVITSHSTNKYLLTVSVYSQGWNYGNILDPTHGKQKLISVMRVSDNVVIPVDNVWQTDRTLRDGEDPLYENRLHFIVNVQGGEQEQYILTFVEKPIEELEVVKFNGIESAQKVYGSVSNLSVVFNKQIEKNSFTTDDIELICQGQHLDTSSIVITPISDVEYSIQLDEFGKKSGYYELTVQTAGITDNEGFNGANGKSINWLQFASVNLTISDAGVATLILPFTDWARVDMQLFTCNDSMSDELLKLVENVDVMTGNRPIFTAYDFDQYGSDINNRPIIEANTPYLVKGKPGNYVFWGMWDEPEQYVYTNGWLTGVLRDMQLVASEGNNQFVLQNQNGNIGFYRVDDENIVVPAYKVFLTVPESVSANIRRFLIVPETTGVKQLDGEVLELQIYNMSGVRLTSPQKGVNIIRMSDGSVRKIIVK